MLYHDGTMMEHNIKYHSFAILPLLDMNTNYVLVFTIFDNMFVQC